jgi:hypothetical protein
MTEPVSQAAGGHWVFATIHQVGDGRVGAHVSIAVDNPGDISADAVDLSIVAGGETLQQIGRPGRGATPLHYISTGATTAIADFVFDNPTNAAPTSGTVTLNGESVTFGFSTGDDTGPLIV